MDFTAYADEVGIPIDALLISSAQLAPWCSLNLYSSFDSSSTQRISSYDPYDVPSRAPSPEPLIHPLKPYRRPGFRSRACEAFIKNIADAEVHFDIAPNAPPPSSATPNGPEVGRLQELTPQVPLDLIPMGDFGFCRTQSPLVMEDSSHSDEDPMLCIADRSELWARACPIEQINTQLAEGRLSDNAMETSEGNVSDDGMKVTSTAKGRPSDYFMETSED
ncbi:hypothetical protein DFS33DRAFT_1271510 [Desarmillaria ectypa]|nr:hypothetical protein DFS33DRAFT_1271510 [Desarmillaria ectypa]